MPAALTTGTRIGVSSITTTVASSSMPSSTSSTASVSSNAAWLENTPSVISAMVCGTRSKETT